MKHPPSHEVTVRVEMKEKTDDELFTLLSQGNEHALNVLFHRFHRPVLGLCRRLTAGDAAKADEISQHTWIQVIRISPRYEPKGRLKAFLFSVARNQAKNILRKDLRWEHRELDEERTLDTQPGADALIENYENVGKLRSMIDQLPDRQRFAIMAWISSEGTLQGQLAEEMGISVKAFESLLSRAKSSLQQMMENSGE